MDAAELFRDSLLEFRLIFFCLGIFVSPPRSLNQIFKNLILSKELTQDICSGGLS